MPVVGGSTDTFTIDGAAPPTTPTQKGGYLCVDNVGSTPTGTARQFKVVPK